MTLCFVFLVSFQPLLKAQSPCDLGGIHAFCTDDNPLGITYQSGTGSGNASSFLGSNSAGCLGSTPRAAWYYMRVDNPGSILIYIEQFSNSGAGIDVDFACWGPFPTSDVTTFLTNLCNNTYTLFTSTTGHPGSHRPANGNHANNNTGGWPYPSNWTGNNIPMTDCSYYADYTEWCFIPNTQYGEIYLLLLTNFNGSAGQITFNAETTNYTTGTTDCNVLMSIESNGPVCEGQVLTLSYPNATASGLTYQWSGPNNFSQTTTGPTVDIANATSAMSGYYKLVMTSGSAHDTVYSDSIVVIATPQVSFSIADSTQFCEGDSVALTISITNHDYAWFNVNNTGYSVVPSANVVIPTFTIHDDTTFTVQVQVNADGTDCYATYSVRYLCARTSSDLIEDQICVGQSYNRYGFTLPIQNTEKDTLLLAVYPNSAGCDSTSQVMLHVTPNPIIELLQNDSEHCVDASGNGLQDANLIVSVAGGTGELQYTWTPALTYTDPDSLLNISGGTYSLTVVDSLGCEAKQTFVVEAIPNPVACFTLTPESPSYIVGETIVFNNCSQYQDQNHWDMGDNYTTDEYAVTYVYNEIGAYTITLDVEDEAGCSDHYEKLIEVHEKMRFYLPNSFTPNGDGVNDVFVPVQMEVDPDSYTLYIYDRYGSIIFTTKSLTEGWDGTIRGKLVSHASTFPYFATYKDYDGVLYEKRCYVTVVY